MSQFQNLTTSELTLDGSMAELSRLSQHVAQYCAAHSLGDDAEFQLNLVLEELFTNSVEHGGCAGMTAAVEIRLEARDGGVHVEFGDRGAPFNPLDAPPPDLTAPLEQRASGGLGVHFVRQMMKHLQYDRSGEWNRLSMELKTI
ncbi:MAG TPA: ATP-binding protein [Candidatus Sulfopaludibacter sp.]|nr:ATP-binding protein [Candidatus Sulfopaludibacter sp.]